MRKLILVLLGIVVAGFMTTSCKKTQIVDPPRPTDSGYKIYKLGDIEDQTELPCFINIMFQVTDMEGNGIATLSQEDFEVLEDNQAVSPSESAMQIRKQEVIPYKMRTVLMLDNSSSVGNDFSEIQAAARSLVNNKMPRQEIAVFYFSDGVDMAIDFSDNINDLIEAINGIGGGYASTNLYGAIIEGVNHWEDNYETEVIEQGFMILFTDGSDTQATHTLDEALLARGEKKVYAVALGNEVEPSVLSAIGNSGFYNIENVSELTEKFEEIQDEMAGYANSFYWLNYMSPKRGDFDHTLQLKIIDNANKASDSYLEGNFNSNGFYSVMQGLYINASPIDDDGIEEIEVAENDTVQLIASTYLGYNPPQYIWESSNSAVIDVEYDEFTNNFAIAIARADSGEFAEVTVRDLANDLQNTIVVKITKATIPTEGLVANYTFTNGSVEDQWANYDGLNYGTHPITDRFGNENAIAFDGFNDKVDISSSLLTSGSKSISFWVKFNELNQYQTIMTNSYGAETNDEGLLIALLEQNNLSVKLGNGSEVGYFMNTNTSSTFGDTDWYHIVVNFDGESLKVYVNTELRASTTSNQGNEAEAIFDLRFGASYQPLPQFLNGNLDDARFYNRILTSDEIQLLFNEGGFE